LFGEAALLAAIYVGFDIVGPQGNRWVLLVGCV